MGNRNFESIIFIAQSADGGRALSIRYKFAIVGGHLGRTFVRINDIQMIYGEQCFQENIMFGHLGCTFEAVACTFGNQLYTVDNPRSLAVVLINARGQSRRPAGGPPQNCLFMHFEQF